jgi:dihydrolipoamide dehydrogenase
MLKLKRKFSQAAFEKAKAMRTNVRHVFSTGASTGQPMLAHKAVHESHVATTAKACELQGNRELARAVFYAKVIPSVAYTDSVVAWVGLTEDQAKAQGIKIKKDMVTAKSWAAAWSARTRAT